VSASASLFNFDYSAVIDISAAAEPQPIQKILYDRKSAAFALSISVRSLDYLIANKRLNTLRMGSKVMIGHGELVKFSRANHATLSEANNG
jgi:hypothetical protein